MYGPFDPENQPPDFKDLDAANTEVRYLRRQLYLTRLAEAKQVGRRVLAGRSVAGTIKALRAEVESLKSQVADLTGSANAQS